ncbi:MAG: protoheme IX farnesyltransferase [Gammaproteobacteria bacterium]|nr:protoheme IX farnesyltransferase [Gammaproteobacteria bacterium]
MNTAVPHARRSAAAIVRDVVSLFKLRIGVLIMITALVGLSVTPGPGLGWAQVLVLALSVLGASASAGAFNQYYERDHDRLMARTRERAFVTGALRASPAWLYVIALMLLASVGAAAWVLNPLSALFVFLGAFFYGVVYTVWLKRRTWWNIVIGGLAGSFAVLAGAAAVDPSLGPLPLLLSLVLFLWTPPHFWSLAIAHRSEYARAGVPMLPVVAGEARAARAVLYATLMLVAISLLPGLFGAGPIYLVGALAGGAYFIAKAAALSRAPSRRTAMASFLASLVQLSVLLIAAGVDSVSR